MIKKRGSWLGGDMVVTTRTAPIRVPVTKRMLRSGAVAQPTTAARRAGHGGMPASQLGGGSVSQSDLELLGRLSVISKINHGRD